MSDASDVKPQNIQLSVRGVLGILATDIVSAKVVGQTIEVTKKNLDVMPVEDSPENRKQLKAWLK